MNEEAKKLKEEREKNDEAFYRGVYPSRVPIKVNVGMDIIAEAAGYDLKETLWDTGRIYDKAHELAEMIFSDSSILGMKSRMPAFYEALGSHNCVMSSNGFMQHPDTVALFADEYDEFIENPVDFIIEKVLPRNYDRLNHIDNPAGVLFSLLEAEYEKATDNAAFRSMSARLTDEFGYPSTMPGTFGACYATMDLLTDNMRSLTEMTKDIRRIPDKVEEALNALYPFSYYVGKPSKFILTTQVSYPLHLAMFIRTKDFERLWWPTWFRQVNDYASLGATCSPFCEADWMRFLDYLQDLPTNSQLKFEYGDPKIIMEKLGKKHIISGMFPLSYLTTLTKEQCIDKTKEWLDILAPGGRYIFGFDKSALMLNDMNFENLAAICETVRTYGVYDHPYEPNGCKMLDPSEYTHSEVPEVRSKYLVSWDDYKAKYPNAPDNARARVEATKLNTMKEIATLIR